MNRPTTTLAARVTVADVLAAREAGMLPASVANAAWVALERLGPLELLQMEQEHAEYRSWERARDAARKGVGE